MDSETTSWCRANGLFTKTIQILEENEFLSIKALEALTADVIEEFGLSSGQKCLLKKGVKRLQEPHKPLDGTKRSVSPEGTTASSDGKSPHRSL